MVCTASVLLGRRMAEAVDLDLPAEVAAKTKLHLLDTLAAVLSGSRLPPGRFAARFADGLGGRPEATILGTGIVTNAVNAALANGMAGHADETDDSHLASRSHLGCAVVPAALAVAERNGEGGRALLNAVAFGYDVGARSTIALGYGPAKTQKHSTHSLAATMGSAAAAGTLIRPDPDRAITVLAYAAQQASGVPSWNRDPDHIEKAFDFGGMGARNGVFAALIAEAGATGVRDPLTGTHSYLEAFAERGDPDALTRGLGVDFEIMRASIKKWCVGSPIQAALDSLVALMTEHGIGADQVERMIVHMPDDRLHVVSDRDIPDICLQHLLALTLADGGLTFASSHDEGRLCDPAVLAIRSRIEAVPSPELTVARPARQAIVDLVLKDGRRLSHHTRAVLGTPDNPMSADQVEEKAADLLEPVIGPSRSRDLIEAVRSLETTASVRDLRPLWA